MQKENSTRQILSLYSDIISSGRPYELLLGMAVNRIQLPYDHVFIHFHIRLTKPRSGARPFEQLPAFVFLVVRIAVV